jgi:putative ABC transport system ATP-binding protein
MEGLKPVIQAIGVRKVYSLYAEEIVALKDFHILISRGEFVSIMGPSGAGKTTLLNLIGCLDKVTEGNLEVLGSDVSLLNEGQQRALRLFHLGFVFQEFFLVQSLTALENVQLPMIFAGETRNFDRAKMLLERVNMAHRMHHLPKELSGGEMQRVAIARALANRPDILLADEPTGNLDTKNAQSLYDLFRELSAEEEVTFLAATHNTQLAYRADRVVHLQEGIIDKDEIVSHT